MQSRADYDAVRRALVRLTLPGNRTGPFHFGEKRRQETGIELWGVSIVDGDVTAAKGLDHLCDEIEDLSFEFGVEEFGKLRS